MSTPEEQLQDQVKTALKAGQKERVATLRMLLSEIKNERIKTGRPLDEKGLVTVVQRAVKQRRDAIRQFTDGGRPELAAKEEREAEILAEFLPTQVGEDELRAAIEATVAELGLSGPSGLGPIMQAMMGRFAGRADGSTINRIARDVLS